MATVGMNDVKNGMKILVNNEPAVITETESVSYTHLTLPTICSV